MVNKSTKSKIGHNQPPADPFIANLTDSADPLSRRLAALEISVAKLPKGVRDEADAGEYAGMVKELRALAQDTDNLRKLEKEPHLTAGRKIDAFFADFLGKINGLKDNLEDRIGAWQAKREAEERARRAEEARLAAEAAAKLEREARKKRATEDDRLAAAAARLEAEDAKAAEEEASADIVRIKAPTGAVSMTVKTVVEGVDRATVDLEALRPYFTEEALLKAARALLRDYPTAGAPKLRGVTFGEDRRTLVR